MITDQELNHLAQATAELVRDTIAPLKARLAALEARPASLKYCGIWDSAEHYAPDEAVTHAGSLWIARDANSNVRPGDGLMWQLAVKRGRDAR